MAERPAGRGKEPSGTGANAGIGYFTAEQLAANGATVVLGCRDTTKGDLAIRGIRAQVPDARLRCVRLDLSDLPSLPVAVDALDADSLDAVVLNARILLSGISAHGHELIFATNHLGHFALALARTTAQRLRGLPAGVALHGKHAAATAVRAVLDSEIDGGQLWGATGFRSSRQPHRETPRI
ncbi:SDR family NAD(P)-dependent oxidoreductase [Nocardia sp. NPDC127606]|uniref:SDR family NAD(P)-dependent oxidoreductase n=1 Tax=Nocardia sp. NPDC127606 TaxID=3345406 RepID=UPI003635D007